MKTVLRIALIVLLAFVAVRVGLMFAPRLARIGAKPPPLPGTLSAEGNASQPDWGGGRLSFRDKPVNSVVESVAAAQGGRQKTQAYSSAMGGVVLAPKSDSDHSVTLAMPSPRRPGRTAVFEMPSANGFRKQLLPNEADAEPPAADIPLYTGARCRMQVGRGTACFIGFYLTPDSIEAVRSFYVKSLTRLGWQRVASGSPGHVETFTKRREDRTVVVQMREQDSATTRIGLVATSPGGHK